MVQNTGIFEKNVFINCPFDPDYRKMLYALVFTVIKCGLVPRIALERDDSGEERINKIKKLIRCSKYSIHDISRMEPLKEGDLPRFNLPFELGLDLGCRTYGKGRLVTKKKKGARPGCRLKFPFHIFPLSTSCDFFTIML